MKNKLFNLMIGAVIALAIFSSVTTINYLREDKVLLATTCPDTYQECRDAILQETNCWELRGDEETGCCIKVANCSIWEGCKSACW